MSFIDARTTFRLRDHDFACEPDDVIVCIRLY